jgi:glutamate 5-kinase
MVTKLRAARVAARSGASTLIASGHEPNVLSRLLQGETLGTFLVPDETPLQARKRWLAGQLKPKGTLHLDAGAARVLRESGKSLLPIGVTAADGQFVRGDLVACLAVNGEEVARGLVNYDIDETRLILRQPSHRIETLLGYVDEPELIHRDNLVLS